jgi:hypothetical protein
MPINPEIEVLELRKTNFHRFGMQLSVMQRIADKLTLIYLNPCQERMCAIVCLDLVVLMMARLLEKPPVPAFVVGVRF